MNRDDLRNLSRLREKEAKILLENHCFHGAYYLLGYAVECALKACIAKQIRLYDFPDKTVVDASYTHNLEKLLNLSGLKSAFESEWKTVPQLSLNWTLVKDWSEQLRYDPSILENQARDFFSAVTQRRYGVLPWLRKRW